MSECEVCGKQWVSQAAANACCTDDDETFGDEPAWWRSIN